MLELFEASFSWVNLIPTILFVFVILYWVIVIIGVFDVDFIDFELDGDMDIDVDVDAGAEVDIQAGGFSQVLSFFNIGQMPFMIFMSFLALPMWVFSILINYYLSNTSVIVSLLLLIPIFLASLFVSKIITSPIARFYRKIRSEGQSIDPVGKECKVILPASPDQIGQAEIRYDGITLRINVMTKDMTLNKGETAFVIEYQKDKNLYLIEPY